MDEHPDLWAEPERGQSVYIITIGDSTHGFKNYGPFGSKNKANNWALQVEGDLHPDSTWWVSKLLNPSSKG